MNLDVKAIMESSSKKTLKSRLSDYLTRSLYDLTLKEFLEIFNSLHFRKRDIELNFSKGYLPLLYSEIIKSVKVLTVFIDQYTEEGILKKDLRMFKSDKIKDVILTYSKNKRRNLIRTKNKVDKEKIEEYTNYVKTLRDNDKKGIKSEINSPFVKLDTMHSYFNNNELVIDNNKQFKDFKRMMLNVNIVSQKQYKILKPFKLKVKDLEFIKQIRLDMEIDLNEEDGEILKSHNLHDKNLVKTINDNNYKKYRKLMDYPIYLVKRLNLNGFYELRKKMGDVSKFSIEKASRSGKFINKINLFYLEKGDNKKLTLMVDNTRKYIDREYTKIPKKKQVILYVNNKSNLFKLLEKKEVVIKKDMYSLPYNACLNKVMWFNPKTLKVSSKYSYGMTNLIDGFYNQKKWLNTQLENGYSVNAFKKQLRRPIIKNLDLSEWEFFSDYKKEEEKFLISEIRRKYKDNEEKSIKHMISLKMNIIMKLNKYPLKNSIRISRLKTEIKEFEEIKKNISGFRVIPIHDFNNPFDLKDYMWVAFIPFIHKVLDVKDKSKFPQYLVNWLKTSNLVPGEKLMKLLIMIFDTCFFSFNVDNSFNSEKHDTSDEKRQKNFNKLDINEVKRVKNDIADLTMDLRLNTRPSKQESFVIRESLSVDISDYVKDQLEMNVKMIESMFEKLNLGDRVYFEKLLKTYVYKVNEYKMGLSLGLLSKKHYKLLVSELRNIFVSCKSNRREVVGFKALSSKKD